MLPSLFRDIIADHDPDHAGAIILLRALGIARVSFSLNGEGDSGECFLEEVEYADGRLMATLPKVPIGFTAEGVIRFLPPFVENIAADLPEGDWVNNEGGYGTVTILPFEEDPDSRFDCDMTYRDYYDDDDDEFEDLELEDDEPDTEMLDEGVPRIRIEEAGQ